LVAEERYIYLDYVGGWIGIRMEPKDLARADALAQLVPANDRKYLHPKRLWIFRPRHLRTVVRVLNVYCPGFPVLVQPEHAELLTVALQVATEEPTEAELLPPRPPGVAIGNLTEIVGR
jgi:hypothetical protein